jgi:hypothetical protein
MSAFLLHRGTARGSATFLGRQRRFCGFQRRQWPRAAETGVFDPARVGILGDALEDAWRSVRSTGSEREEKWTREILARCIIDVAKLGERDQRKLREVALTHWAEAYVRKGRDWLPA